ncbi:MAG: DUF3298 and DUF4163 domain-containing protein [Patescibacteria group bacterium]
MKKRYLWILLVMIVVAFSAGYFLQTTHRLGELKYSVQKITLGSEKEKFTMEAEYPVIESGIPEKVKNSINAELEKWARDGVEKSKSDFEDLLKDPVLTQSDLGLTYISKATMKNDFTKLPYINVSFETYYYSGGAHGITDVSTFVYDANTGKRIALSDLFVGDYLNTLSTLSLAELKKIDPKLETYSFALDGTKPLLENFKTWTLEPDGMHIIFSDYQVGPYVAGRPEIVLSYASLDKVLSADFKQYFLK